jgi:hypothetical protein
VGKRDSGSCLWEKLSPTIAIHHSVCFGSRHLVFQTPLVPPAPTFHTWVLISFSISAEEGRVRKLRARVNGKAEKAEFKLCVLRDRQTQVQTHT